MGALKKVVKLNREDFKTLTENGAVTVDGQTIEYSEDDIYVVPNIEIDHSQFVDKSSNQEIVGEKVFVKDDSRVTINGNGFVLSNSSGMHGVADDSLISIAQGKKAMYASGAIGVEDLETHEVKAFMLPEKSGTLATTDDGKKYYRHSITLGNSDISKVLTFCFISSRATRYNNPFELIDDVGMFTNARYEEMNTGVRKLCILMGVYEGESSTSAYVSAEGLNDGFLLYENFTIVLANTPTEI